MVVWEVGGALPDCFIGNSKTFNSKKESHNVENSHGCSPKIQSPTEQIGFFEGKKER